MQYTFNTKSVFILGKALSHFKDEVDEVVSLIPALAKVAKGEEIFDHVEPDKLMGIVTRVIGKSAEAEDLAIEFLANASRLSHADIHAMDGYTFMAELKNALVSVDWTRLLKESIGLTLSPQNPLKAESKPEMTTPSSEASVGQS